MPVVNTYHQNKETCDVFYSLDAESKRIQEIVLQVTEELVRENAHLVAEVESDLIDKSVLEVEIIKIIDRMGYSFIDRDRCIEKVFDWMFGYGILQELIDDPEISDVDMSRYNMCIIKKNGVNEFKQLAFKDESTFEKYLMHIISRRGGIINQNDSHCRVADIKKRLRINGSIWPRNVTGPALQIRKHPMHAHTFDDLERLGMLNSEVSDLLRKLARSSAKIFFTGKGAAGKTTLYRTVLNSFNPLEKVLVLESDVELYPDNPAIIVQKIKKSSEGGKTVLLLDLVQDGLTMSLDTYAIGEMVGKEAWTVISAGINGHRILSSLHTNTALHTFERLQSLISLSGIDIGEEAIKKIIASSVDIIIHMRAFKIVEIIEVVGYEDGQYITNELYSYKIDKIDDNERIDGKYGAVGKLRGRLATEFVQRGYY